MKMKKKIASMVSILVIGYGLYLFRMPLARWVLENGENSAAAKGSAPQEAADSATGRKALYWVDPMHPAYKSDKPGIAPDCGMQLVPVYADEVEKMAQMPAGTVTISAERQQLIGVKLVRVERQPVKKTIRAVAKLTYDESRIVHFHSKVEGYVEEVFVNTIGTYVKSGQPLFTLYSPELVAAQQEYLIALRADRQLSASPVPEVARSTRTLLEAARQKLALWDVSAEQIVRLEESGQPQRTVTFYAEHGGVVTEKKIFEHLRVTPDTDLYTFIDLSRLWAIAEVYEFEAPMVRVGQSVNLTLPYQTRAIQGRVSFVYPEISPETRTLRVRMDVANPGGVLRPDMFANAEINVDLGSQLVVPADAVVETGTKRYVYFSRGDGFFEPRDIEIGSRTDDAYIVLSGLRAGDLVAGSANFLIDSESKLRSGAGAGASQHQHEPEPMPKKASPKPPAPKKDDDHSGHQH